MFENKYQKENYGFAQKTPAPKSTKNSREMFFETFKGELQTIQSQNLLESKFSSIFQTNEKLSTHCLPVIHPSISGDRPLFRFPLQFETSSSQVLAFRKPLEDDNTSESDSESSDIEEEVMTEKLRARSQSQRKKLGISAEVIGHSNSNFVPKLFPKPDDEHLELRGILRRSFLFEALEDKQQELVIDAMERLHFAAGTSVIQQGDDGCELYVVISGKLSCTKKVSGGSGEVFLRFYTAGEVFGELSLLYNVPRAASIATVEASTIYALSREVFNHIVRSAAVQKRQRFEQFLSKIDFLQELTVQEREKICDCLKTDRYVKGEFVIREGEEGNSLFFIQQGTVEALKKNKSKQETVFMFKENDYFGELALINNEKRKASIRVTSDELILTSIDRMSFKRLLGSVEELLKRNSAKYEQYVKGLGNLNF